MTVTDLTNTTLAGIARELLSCDSIAITGHVGPDGDCVGSQLALGLALKEKGKHVIQLLAEDAPLNASLAWLPGADEMIFSGDYDAYLQENPNKVPDVFVTCDVGMLSRIGAGKDVYQRIKKHITIDHHAVDTCISDFNYVDPDAPATCMLIGEVIDNLGQAWTPDVATCCYCGLSTDTGSFCYQNTTPESFSFAIRMIEHGADPATIATNVYQSRSLASLKLEQAAISNMHVSDDGLWAYSFVDKKTLTEVGGTKFDTDTLVDKLRCLEGTQVVCMLREDEPHSIRGSFRAKNDQMDVSVVAQKFNGGGHRAAAGFTYKGSLDAACKAVAVELEKLVKGFAKA